ncbi:Gfo/Idh/MocA family oxidoreductase [Thalassotalea sp. 1_MG-2023]|uniref:Gfo/Idh/MocA family protein n=1 Tax=Thalassotalea sp. 1_MG-2023 TaxID=3062680 RepID=UPI0026E1DAE1|nr:Gfo/Idh/MocA family oxidoreductase [Thalassotalea sp. 1_MG-2023]MDO6427153.1 Gfo/Idh/MocA family oxidoreductase [Thalassotalea sp. 1_MG-2023]
MKIFDRRFFIKSAAAISTTHIATTLADTFTQISPSTLFDHKSVMHLIAPKMATVRIGFIGLGERGLSHVKHCSHIDGIEIKALCDIDQNAMNQASQYLEQQKITLPDEYSGSKLAYKDMLTRNDIDIVIISTPTEWHTPMAVDTMNSNKHAFVEVPAATSVDECWLLVDTSERTQKNCMMMESACYGQKELMVLQMVKQGLFGELKHGESTSLIELHGQQKQEANNNDSSHKKIPAHLYPTHGLGPISQYMNINRGDQFDFLTADQSTTLKRTEATQNQSKPVARDFNTTVITTKLGRTINVKHEINSQSPYTHHTVIQGTNGTFSGPPNRITLEKLPVTVNRHYQNIHQLAVKKWQENGQKGQKPDMQNQQQWNDNMAYWQEHYQHPLWQSKGAEAFQNGETHGKDFLMMWRIIYCLRNGQALDQSVYDAAALSVISPLMTDLVTENSNRKDIPDFTRGLWKNTAPISNAS